MRVLIIGGTGLISAALTRQLAARGEQVTVFNRGQREVSLPAGVRQLSGDRYNAAVFVREMRSAGDFDCVIDMIAYQPQDAASLLEAFAGRTEHLIVSSTTDVYAKPAPRYPYTEAVAYGGIGAYPLGKAACEKLLLEAHAEHGLPVTILRPAHTYGIGGHHRGHVIHSMGKGTFFLDRLRKGKPVIVHGDGSSLWASCHLEDVARGFAGAVGNPAAIGKTYHLTGGEAMTWNRYHETVARAMDAPAPELVHIPTDVLRRVAPDRCRLAVENFQFNNIFDNSAAERDLGFRQTISFADGMRETLPWVERTYGFDSSDDDPLYDRLIDAWRSVGDRLAAELAGLDR